MKWLPIAELPSVVKFGGFEFLGLFDYGLTGRWPSLVRYNATMTEFEKVGQCETGQFIIEPVRSGGAHGTLIACMELNTLPDFVA